jgi:excisionase family DNA binding protein
MTTITITDEGTLLAYSPPAAARILGVSRAWMYRLLQRGTLPSLKIGKRVFVRHEDLQALLDSAPLAHPQETSSASA